MTYLSGFYFANIIKEERQRTIEKRFFLILLLLKASLIRCMILIVLSCEKY